VHDATDLLAGRVIEGINVFAMTRRTVDRQTRISAPTAAAGLTQRAIWERKYSRWLLITDSLVVCVAVILAQYARFGLAPGTADEATARLTGFSIIFAILWLAMLAISRTRSSRTIGSGVEEYRRIFSASFWTFGTIAILTLILKLEVARGYFAIAFPIGLAGLLLTRHMWRQHITRARLHGKFKTAVLAIGDERGVTTLTTELMRNSAFGYDIVGVGIPGYGPGRGETITVQGHEVPILGDEVYALESIEECGADTVAVTGTEYFGANGLRQLTWQLEALNVDLVVTPGVMDVAGGRLTLRPVAGFPLVHVERPQYHGAKRFQKRMFDFCFALAALIGTSPLLLLVAIAIKLTSRGPVFYSAERIGLNGKPFTMLKFRSMVDDAEKLLPDLNELNEINGGVLFKIRDDPRVTSIGRIIRRFSIDELPQFINVLKQDMSVVGPRPPLRREVESYDAEVMRRLLVKPGVTGLWQVSGRSDLSWEDSVRLDLSYIENWSMIGDLLIILKTLRAVLNREGAY
jgi:exopolysaccharide biosynthesis polyprenyl glycosylphosphotransferase